MADKPGVNIPISVTGADSAQAELKQTGAEVESLKEAGDAGASGLNQAGQAAGDALPKVESLGSAANATGKNLGEFDDKGKAAARTVLGTINPTISNAFGLFTDLAEGIGRVGAQLGLFALLATALSGVVTAVQSAIRAVERLETSLQRARKAQRDLSQEGRSQRDEIIDELVAAGIGANAAPAAQRRIRELNLAGIDDRLARPTALFEARGLLDPEDRRAAAEFQAGIIASGGDAPSLTGDLAGDRRIFNELQRLGQRDEARRARFEFIEQTRRGARASAPAATTLVESPIDDALAQFQRNRADATDGDSAAIESLILELDRVLRSEDRRGITSVGGRLNFSGVPLGGVAIPDDAELPRDVLEAEARRIFRELLQREGGVSPRTAAAVSRSNFVERPVQIRVTNITNVNTAYSLPNAAGAGFLNPIDQPGGSPGGGE